MVEWLSSRFFCANTIEERIVALQDRKKEMAGNVLSGWVCLTASLCVCLCVCVCVCVCAVGKCHGVLLCVQCWCEELQQTVSGRPEGTLPSYVNGRWRNIHFSLILCLNAELFIFIWVITTKQSLACTDYGHVLDFEFIILNIIIIVMQSVILA